MNSFPHTQFLIGLMDFSPILPLAAHLTYLLIGEVSVDFGGNNGAGSL